jgi:hypothetical protein
MVDGLTLPCHTCLDERTAGTELVKRTAAERHFFFLIALVGGLAILSSTMSKTPVLTGFLVGAWGYGAAFSALASVLALSALIFVFAPQLTTAGIK